ncbi:MAG TPA: NADPH-dependent FMN reductase [Candidatus Saccharimonadales bacterium]|jgi:NAD(P)H-dependent FMN reductase|nr:NADPH-dependent FMN reductase [Candidatus Saccharimonadales bacterium]
MFYIPVILGSTRRNRESVKVATFALNALHSITGVETALLDLKEMNLPIMEERLRFRDDPPPGLAEFSAQVGRADALVIVTPEYNSGYPGVLKNALDYLVAEYKRKPFGIITVSAGGFGGLLCLASLRQVVLALGGVPIPANLPVSKVQESFNAEGKPADPAFQKRAQAFFDELMWFTEALAAQRKRTAGA